MKKKVFVCVLCIALLACIVTAGGLAASATETRTITQHMDFIQQQVLSGKISLDQYTQSVRSLNRLLESKNIDEIKATVTYESALSIREAYRITQKDDLQVGSVGNAILSKR